MYMMHVLEDGIYTELNSDHMMMYIHSEVYKYLGIYRSDDAFTHTVSRNWLMTYLCTMIMNLMVILVSCSYLTVI